MEEKIYPFPFWGAGNADYFEWLTIRFINEPTKEQKKQLKSIAPRSFKDFYFKGKILIASDDRFSHTDIEEAYDNPESIKKRRNNILYFTASEKANNFNEEIEKWILKIHQICPIQFCERAVDKEVEDTAFSNWHVYSIAHVQAFLEKLAEEDFTKISFDEYESLKYSLENICSYANLKLEDPPEKIITQIFPLKKFEKLLAKPQTEQAALIFFEENYQNKRFKHALINVLDSYAANGGKQKTKKLFKICDCLLKSDKGRDLLFKHSSSLSAIILLAIKENHPDFLIHIEDYIKNTKEATNLVNELSIAAYTLITDEDYKTALQLYELALYRTDYKKTPELTLYCTALWVLQNDNTGLPINLEKNHEWLTKCLPFAPKDPNIYFNAACLYVEMNDLDKAFECIELAKKHKYKGFKAMIDAIKVEKIFSEFRKDQRYKEYVKK